jgi:teichuronic acid biosynthesis glycosyltransferase TuaC
VRTLVVTTSFPRSAGDAGGHFVEAQARRFASEGDEVEVIAPGKPHSLEVRDGLRIHWLGGERAFGWPGVAARARSSPVSSSVGILEVSLRVGRVVDALVRSNGTAPIRIVAHWLVPSVWPWLAVPRTPSRIEAHAHGGDVRVLAGLPSVVRHRVVRSILARVESLRFASRSLKEGLAATLEEPSLRRDLERRSAVELPDLEMPEAALAKRSREPRRRPFLSEKTPLLAIALGRLVEAKGYAHAVRAIARHGGTHLLVVGDGPARASLERCARELAAPVTFLGRLERHEALDWLAAADVLLHPSQVEAAPTAIREARALGVPVIASPAGDVAAWASVDRGIRCVPAEPGAIAAELDRLARQLRLRSVPV